MGTEWEIRLREYVSGGLKKLAETVGGTQKQFNNLTGTLDKAARASVASGREFKRSYNDQANLLRELEKRQEAAYSTKHIEAYQKMIDKTRQEMERLNKIRQPKVSQWQDFKNNAGGVMSQIPGGSNLMALGKNPYTWAAAGIVAAGAGLKNATEDAYDWEKSMAKVNATTQLSAQELGLLSNQLKAIGGDSGGNFARLPDAYEKVISITGDKKMSLDIIKAAVNGAKAGFEDIDVVAGGLAMTMSAVGDKTLKAKDLLDEFMMAKNVGAGNFGSFAQYMPELIAGAHVAGYKKEDAIGLFSTMTKQFGAAQSQTYVQNLMTAFQKQPIIKGLSTGVFGAKVNLFDHGERRPILDVMQDFKKLSEQLSKEDFGKFLSAIDLNDVQAKTAVGALLGNMENMETVFAGMTKAAGETGRQLSATNGAYRDHQKVLDQWSKDMTEVGTKTLPIWDGFLKLLSSSLISVTGARYSHEQGQKDQARQSTYDMTKENYQSYFDNKVSKFNKQHPGQSPEIYEKRLAQKYYNEEYKKVLDMRAARKGVSTTDEEKMKETIALAKLAVYSDVLNRLKKPKAGTSTKPLTQQMVDDLNAGSGNGGNSGGDKRIGTLIMHVHNNNTIKGEKDEKVMRKVSDDLVDAARDAMVSIGIN